MLLKFVKLANTQRDSEDESTLHKQNSDELQFLRNYAHTVFLSFSLAVALGARNLGQVGQMSSFISLIMITKAGPPGSNSCIQRVQQYRNDLSSTLWLIQTGLDQMERDGKPFCTTSVDITSSCGSGFHKLAKAMCTSDFTGLTVRSSVCCSGWFSNCSSHRQKAERLAGDRLRFVATKKN